MIRSNYAVADSRLPVPRQTVDDLVGAGWTVGVTRLGNDRADNAQYAGRDETVAEDKLVYRVTHPGPLGIETCEQIRALSEVRVRDVYYSPYNFVLTIVNDFYESGSLMASRIKTRTSVMHLRARFRQEGHRQGENSCEYPGDRQSLRVDRQ